MKKYVVEGLPGRCQAGSTEELVPSELGSEADFWGPCASDILEHGVLSVRCG